MKILLINTVLNHGSVGKITADLYQEIEASGNEAFLGIGRGTWDPAYKGMMIGIVGSIRTGSYNAQDGTKRYTTDGAHTSEEGARINGTYLAKRISELLHQSN